MPRARAIPHPTGMSSRPIGMVETLEAARQHPLWQNREASREQGHGVGIAIGGWMGGLEPGASVCKLNRDGVLQVQIGTADLSGTPTTFAMLAAEAYGVSPDKVRFVYSDTDSAPYGGGVGGSKTTYTLGNAVIRAAQDARRQTLAVAAEEFEVSAEDLEIVDGRVQVRGFPERSISLGEIAGKAMTFGGKYEPVHGNGRQAVTDRAPSFCAQIAECQSRRRNRRCRPVESGCGAGSRTGNQPAGGGRADAGRRGAGRRLGALRGDALR